MWEKRSIPYALVALTNLHIGTIENVSDLVMNPIYRDSFGFIRINGNVLKGSIRSSFETDNCFADKQGIIKYLFGLGSRADYSESRIGSIIFHDFFLFLLPLPHEDYGLVYLTSPAILFEGAKLFDILAQASYKNKDKEKSDDLTTSPEPLENYSKVSSYLCSLATQFLADGDKLRYYAWIFSKNEHHESKLWLWDFYIPVKIESSMQYLLKLKNKILESIFGEDLFDFMREAPIIIAPDYLLRSLLLHGLDITPHIKLEGYRLLDDNIIYNKVVELGPWFQEEIPKFSIFLGGITINLRKRSIEIPKDLIYVAKDLCKRLRITQNRITCDINNLDELALILDEIFSIPRIIGGKESTGLGLYQLTRINNINIPNYHCKEASSINHTDPKLAGILSSEDIWKLIFSRLPQLYSSSEARNKLLTLIERIRRIGLLGLIAFYMMKSNTDKGKDKKYAIILDIIGDILKKMTANPKYKKDSFSGYHLKLLFDNIFCYNDNGDRRYAESFYDNYYLFIQALNKLRRLI